jgi:YgiT-type zinc finger domain-containing protein
MSEAKRCRVCGTPTEVRRENYKYDASGLDNITLQNIEVRHCPKCGERQALIPSLAEYPVLGWNSLGWQRGLPAPSHQRIDDRRRHIRTLP